MFSSRLQIPVSHPSLFSFKTFLPRLFCPGTVLFSFWHPRFANQIEGHFDLSTSSIFDSTYSFMLRRKGLMTFTSCFPYHVSFFDFKGLSDGPSGFCKQAMIGPVLVPFLSSFRRKLCSSATSPRYITPILFTDMAQNVSPLSSLAATYQPKL